MKFLKKLPDAEILKEKYSLSDALKLKRKNIISEIKLILKGKSNKKILCIGPCSADNEDAVLTYVYKLAKIAGETKDKLVIVPRIYTSKPRTTGTGYKGLLHRPLVNNIDQISAGIIAMRKLHLHVIQETEMVTADEMLYPEATYYIEDLLGYIAIGARSVENQQHRLVASGVNVPVGMKNPTSGDLDVLLNAITAAQAPQSFLYHGWECSSEGNSYTHAILRGYVDSFGNSHPNYHYENLSELHDLYIKRNLKNMGVIVDCNHSNSNKHYDEQIRISKDVLQTCSYSKELNKFVKGLMIESYLEDGSQMIDEGVFGKSITDPCLGWNKTEKLIYEIAELI